ncbi:MAG: sigma-54 dependent transcriptional regulator [Oryzomonas sp.]|uniref:sigma-54-dependent transcriptional regulator n=1 Tax=Oryzomonas sp. TaxID=2855186 RepID=UPI00284F156C|nr:sigma-54 dependent transcriptional regulator [Oryzomonas sp.]MDR3581351.1 sigma-54 dependent transcriptional regulator [Oryzomonas sp.]
MTNITLLIIEDDLNLRKGIAAYFRYLGYSILEASNGKEGLEVFERGKPDIVFTDLRMPVLDGFAVIKEITQQSPDTPIIVISGTGVIIDAIQAMRLGAKDYVVKPIHEMEELELIVDRALTENSLRHEVDSLKRKLLGGHVKVHPAFSPITTQAPSMLAVLHYLEVVAVTGQPVLINGETGVGKELLSQAIHTISSRKGAFIAINVAGLDDQMFSDTLFGHLRGAFTGADRIREGLLAQARGGTLFLDEIGDLNESSQIKLLRLLQEGEYYPLGSDMPRKTDARIVVATHCDLRAMMEAGNFRKDLYYRLATHQVVVPSLKDRHGDIPLLLDRFLDDAAAEMAKKRPTPSPELSSYLESYHFPGNIRELKAMVFDAVAQHTQGVLSMNSFLKAIGRGRDCQPPVVAENGAAVVIRDAGGERIPTLKEAEDALIADALKRANGNQGVAAGYLGINRSALNKKIQKRKNNFI